MRRSDRGSAAAEFVMVAALLTVLMLSVVQLSIALLVRNTVLDAAAEGARYAALADNQASDGVARTRDLIRTAVGDSYATDVTAEYTGADGPRVVVVTVRCPLPVVGLLGIHRALGVSGRAEVETMDD